MRFLTDVVSWLRRATGRSGGFPLLPAPPEQPADIAVVVERLRSVLDPLPADDGVACFARTYLRVTELVGQQVQQGAFVDPAFIARLDVVFAARFLEAAEPADVAEPNEPSPAWSPLFALRDRHGVEELQFVLAGMNAHINHDLSLALVATCRQLGRRPDEATVREDYDRINGLLAAIVREVRQSYEDAALRRTDADLAPVLDLLSAWSITAARDAAYASALVQWRLQHDPVLLAGYTATQASTVGLVSRHLLTPVALRT